MEYQVYYKVTSDTSFILQEQTLLQPTYTMIGLVPGTYYDFAVKSKNIIGYSVMSETVTILAAQIPDVPENLQNDPVVTDSS